MTETAAQIPRGNGTHPAGRHLAGIGRRRRWIVAGVIALVVHVAAFGLFSVSSLPAERSRIALPRLFWAGAKVLTPESVLGEQIDLLNPAPLFLPTEHNAAGGEGGVREERSPLEIFETYPARLSVAGDRRPDVLRVLPSVDREPAGYVSRFPWAPLAALGRSDQRPTPGLPRLARIEVRAVSDGTLVHVRDMPAAEMPAGANWPEWQPMEALIVVESVGLLGSPLIVRTSGAEAVDGFFRSYLVAEMRPGLILPAGYYRVAIAP